MTDAVPASEADPYVAEFQRRLSHVARSYRVAKEIERATGTYNESLTNLRKALNPWARRKEKRVRLHPYLEVIIKARWLKRNSEAGDSTNGRRPAPAEILEICEDLKRELRAVRGRPSDPILTYHVQGAMALVERMAGHPVRATKAKNSVYEPHMSSSGGRMIECFFRQLDPSITSTQLGNIIRQAHSSGAIEGKGFRDFFPFYGGQVDPEIGHPVLGPGTSSSASSAHTRFIVLSMEVLGS